MNIQRVRLKINRGATLVFLLLSLLLGLHATKAFAAATPNLAFTVGVTNGLTNASVVVPIRVSRFTNISSFQFSMHWNTNVASFEGVEQFGLNGLGASN